MKVARLQPPQVAGAAILRVVLVLTMFVMVAGCASFTKNAYRTLDIAGQTYDAGMKSAADLHRAGKITNVQKAEIIAAAHKYRDSYLLAVDSLAGYEKTNLADDKEKLKIALEEFSSATIGLTQLLTKYIGENRLGFVQ